MTSAGGVELWRGPSRLDGNPIVAIATGLDSKVDNSKTGQMVQTWILRQDVPPTEARRTGEDASICGNCIHRPVGGLGTCYVEVHWSVAAVYRTWVAGRYRPATELDLDAIKAKHVRFGSYGDPAAVPKRVWSSIRPPRGHWSGYTHQWRHGWAHTYQDFLMASVESQAEAQEAERKGWRTFLVVPQNRSIQEGTTWCPSDQLNPGRKVHCEDCGLCSGVNGVGKGGVAIYAHGSSASAFGMRERRPNVPIERTSVDRSVFARIPRDLHLDAKRAAKAEGKPLKLFTREALQERIRRAKEAQRVPNEMPEPKPSWVCDAGVW